MQRIKYYYLAVGLAGMAAAFYLIFTYPAEPPWIAGVLGYTYGTPIAIAITMHIRERRNVKTGRS